MACTKACLALTISFVVYNGSAAPIMTCRPQRMDSMRLRGSRQTLRPGWQERILFACEVVVCLIVGA